MLRPLVAREQNVKRSASVPYAGIPSGNWRRVASAMRGASSGFMSPEVRLTTSDSRSMPSMRSRGSRMFPRDFDIFSPSASSTSPWMYTSSNGTSSMNSTPIMIIRATQKKMMSKPVTRTLVG